jgi:hypothetical protein
MSEGWTNEELQANSQGYLRVERELARPPDHPTPMRVGTREREND